MTPVRMVDVVRAACRRNGRTRPSPSATRGRSAPRGGAPSNSSLAAGWVGFDFAAAFGVPVKVINDATMQACGSYAGGRMLFLGLGTGVGSALVTGRSIFLLELGCLRFTRKRTLHDCLGRAGLARLGLRALAEALADAVAFLKPAFGADYVMLGGGNAKKVGKPPPWSRLGSNLCAFPGRLSVVGAGADPDPDARRPAGGAGLPPTASGGWCEGASHGHFRGGRCQGGFAGSL